MSYRYAGKAVALSTMLSDRWSIICEHMTVKNGSSSIMKIVLRMTELFIISFYVVYKHCLLTLSLNCIQNKELLAVFETSKYFQMSNKKFGEKSFSFVTNKNNAICLEHITVTL